MPKNRWNIPKKNNKNDKELQSWHAFVEKLYTHYSSRFSIVSWFKIVLTLPLSCLLIWWNSKSFGKLPTHSAKNCIYNKPAFFRPPFWIITLYLSTALTYTTPHFPCNFNFNIAWRQNLSKNCLIYSQNMINSQT